MKWRIKKVDIRLNHGEEQELSLILSPEDRPEHHKSAKHSKRLLAKYVLVRLDRRIPPG